MQYISNALAGVIVRMMTRRRGTVKCTTTPLWKCPKHSLLTLYHCIFCTLWNVYHHFFWSFVPLWMCTNVHCWIYTIFLPLSNLYQTLLITMWKCTIIPCGNCTNYTVNKGICTRWYTLHVTLWNLYQLILGMALPKPPKLWQGIPAWDHKGQTLG